MAKQRWNMIVGTLALLFLVGCVDHCVQGQQGHGADIVAEQWAVIPHNPLPSNSTSPIEAGIYDLVRVVDADTLIIGDSNDRTKQYRIRLIGIDAPELARGNTPAEPYANEATEFVKEMIERADNKVRIAFDGEQLDQYRRTRAMVYLTMPDGSEVWLNRLLVERGLAHARLDFRFSHSAKLHFALAELESRKHRRNMWKDGEE